MRRFLILTSFLVAGCQDYLFAPVCPQTIEEARLSATPSDPRPADILFVIDNSGSMADDQKRLADSFDAFITQLSAVPDFSYRIAVVTTDLSSRGGVQRVGEVTYGFQSSAPYEIVTSQIISNCRDSDVPLGCFYGPDPSRRVITSEMPPEEQDAAFNSNATIGSCGSGTEEGLAAAIRALENTDRGRCNEGFLRDDSNLVVIFVSDEKDDSPDAVATYVQQLSQFKPWNRIRAAAIIGSVDGVASDCRVNGGVATAECGSLCNQCPGASWCGSVQANLFDGGCGSCSLYNAPDCCSATPGTRFQQFVNQVDANVKAADPLIGTATIIDTICQDDFSATLKRMATEIIVTQCYPLDDMPVNPEGVAARIAGGRDLVRDVDFRIENDGSQVQVCLNDITLLEPGEELELFYVTSIETRPSVHPGCN